MLGVVRANLENGEAIVLESGVEIDPTKAPAGVKPSIQHPESRFGYLWDDNKSQSISASWLIYNIS